MKKMIIILLSVFIAFSPFLTIGNFCFAESGGGGSSGYSWTNPTTDSEIVSAFKSYCASRRLNITAEEEINDLTKVLVTFDYNMMKNACNALNIDLDTLNAKMWWCIDQNQYLRWFFESPAISQLNSIYNYIINQNNLGENESKRIYSGEWFEDLDGNGCFIYQFTNSITSSYLVGRGGLYKYSGEVLRLHNSSSVTFNINNTYKNLTFPVYTVSDRTYITNDNQFIVYMEQSESNYSRTFLDGYTCIIKQSSNGTRYYIGTYCKVRFVNPSVNRIDETWHAIQQIELVVAPVKIKAEQGEFNTPPDNKSLEVQTDQTTINNTIINNTNNYTYNYYDDDNKPQPPSYTNPYNNNPTGGTIDGNGNINFQMPDININWDLGLDINNLPFPFSIPFDIIRFLTILDTQPQAPKYEIHTEILNNPVNLDIDLSVFDDGMVIIRNIILVGYVIFLIISTRSLFHIY